MIGQGTFFFNYETLFQSDKNACGSKLPFQPQLHKCPDLHTHSTGTQMAKLLVS